MLSGDQGPITEPDHCTGIIWLWHGCYTVDISLHDDTSLSLTRTGQVGAGHHVIGVLTMLSDDQWVSHNMVAYPWCQDYIHISTVSLFMLRQCVQLAKSWSLSSYCHFLSMWGVTLELSSGQCRQLGGGVVTWRNGVTSTWSPSTSTSRGQWRSVGESHQSHHAQWSESWNGGRNLLTAAVISRHNAFFPTKYGRLEGWKFVRTAVLVKLPSSQIFSILNAFKISSTNNIVSVYDCGHEKVPSTV